MPTTNSPLRYPGGKTALSSFLAEVIEANGLHDGVYIEPFAGGSGAGLKLLFGEYVNNIIINDADKCIYSFWAAILNQTTRFIQLLKETPVSIDEWYRQRNIYLNHKRHSQLRVGFASFYLNRCNRSGILKNAGPIGGKEQAGRWKIDARFNKKDLVSKIEKIALYRDRIMIFNMDAIDLLSHLIRKLPNIERALVYLDPPYYIRGSELYLNYYLHEDHANLARYLTRDLPFKWILTYDNAPEIYSLYPRRNIRSFNLNYSANTKKTGSEILIYDDSIRFPDHVTL